MRRPLTPPEKAAVRRALIACGVADGVTCDRALEATRLFDRIPRLAEVRGPRSAVAHVALARRALGITLGHRVYLHREVVGPGGRVPLSLLAHELAHVAQYLRDGTAPFLARYVTAYARNRLRGLCDQDAYLAIPYEVEARAVEAEARRLG